MLLCEDWRSDPDDSRHVTIIGLISNIHAVEVSPYPLLYREMCVFLALTEARGEGKAKIASVFEESGEKVFETREQVIPFGPDPLEVVGVPFRIGGCLFPRPGLYSVQFWYEGEQVEERPIRLR
jgi:hypothetical protein